MLKKVEIENFKSLQHVKLNLTNLNLFLGLNSMGKSSVMQSLLMLRQSYIINSSFCSLFINNDLVSLGNSKDVYYQNGESDGLIKYDVIDEDKQIKASFKYQEGADVLWEAGIEEDAEIVDSMSLFSKDHFHYIAADHIPPAKTYKTSNAGSNKFNILGNNGENAPYYLAKHGSEVLNNKAIHHCKAKSDTLSHELDAWMSEIVPGTRMVSEEMPAVDIVRLSVQFDTKTIVADGKTRSELTEAYSPVNVGFGIPYVFPLILTLLISEPGDLVFVENPESHLHPRGQAELGKLLALAAQSGVQIICETHSDHVINGIRVAVKQGLLDCANVGLYYFNKNQETLLETEVETIKIDKNGELNKYPKGLLDEWGDLMAQLL